VVITSDEVSPVSKTTLGSIVSSGLVQSPLSQLAEQISKGPSRPSSLRRRGLNHMAGKGSRERTSNRKAYNNNFDLIKKGKVEGFVKVKGGKQIKKY
jgi:hypothetical protein